MFLDKLHRDERRSGRQHQLVASDSYYLVKRRESAAIRIQSWFRCLLLRRQYILVRSCIVTIQKLTRGRRIRFAYGLLLGSISSLQAMMRGHVVRRWFSILFQNRMDTYRLQIFLLWKEAHTPLCYRSIFWPLIQLSGFLRLDIAELELNRLWNELNITLAPDQLNGRRQQDGARTLDARLGISDRCFRKAIKVRTSSFAYFLSLSSHRSYFFCRLNFRLGIR
jgi:hypothetical protein